MNKTVKKVTACLSSIVLAVGMLAVSASAAAVPKQRGIKATTAGDAGSLSRNVAQVYKELNGDKLNGVIVATSKDYPDALSGGYLSSYRNAPILYDDSPQTLDYIKKYVVRGSNVYLIGGTEVISSAFEQQAKAAGYNLVRLGGANRYETNLRTLQSTSANNESEILICSALNYPDALASSATRKPVMIVNPNGLSEAQINYIKKGKCRKLTIIGGKGAVKENVENQLKSTFSTNNVTRLGGNTRYDTCALVMEKYCDNASTWVIADGYNYIGALTGAALASKTNAALLLSGKNVFKDNKYGNLSTANSHSMDYYINFGLKESKYSYRTSSKDNTIFGVSGNYTINGYKYESGLNDFSGNGSAFPKSSSTLEMLSNGYMQIINSHFTDIPDTLSYSNILSRLKNGESVNLSFKCYDKCNAAVNVTIKMTKTEMLFHYESSPTYAGI